MGGWVGGWVAGAIKNKAISASNEVEVEVEAELGNIPFLVYRKIPLVSPNNKQENK